MQAIWISPGKLNHFLRLHAVIARAQLGHQKEIEALALEQDNITEAMSWSRSITRGQLFCEKYNMCSESPDVTGKYPSARSTFWVSNNRILGHFGDENIFKSSMNPTVFQSCIFLYIFFSGRFCRGTLIWRERPSWIFRLPSLLHCTSLTSPTKQVSWISEDFECHVAKHDPLKLERSASYYDTKRAHSGLADHADLEHPGIITKHRVIKGSCFAMFYLHVVSDGMRKRRVAQSLQSNTPMILYLIQFTCSEERKMRSIGIHLCLRQHLQQDQTLKHQVVG